VHIDAPIFDHDLGQDHSQELLFFLEGKVLEMTRHQGCKPLQVTPNTAFLPLVCGHWHATSQLLDDAGVGDRWAIKGH
jgi:hypothetical protein